MKILMMVDMEGISGIFCSEQVIRGSSDYAEGQQMLTADVNACVDGAIRGGATEIIVRDAHGGGNNFLWNKLDPRARYVQGRCEQERMPGLATCDGLILLGYHAMAGTPMAVLEHTMSSKAWQNFYLNGQPAGEMAIDAACAADYGVPVIMISGDDKLAQEAAALLPDTVYAEVKQGLGVQAAKLLAPKTAHDLIRKKAEQAVRSCKTIKPLKVKRPVTLRLELVSRGSLPYHRQDDHLKIIDGRTFECTGSTMKEALNRLLG